MGDDGRGSPLPRGVVTFCLTDIVGSTGLWETHRAEMPAAVAAHDRLVADLVAAHGGVLVQAQGEGDSTLAAFGRPADAVAAATAIHAALAGEPPPTGVRMRVRIGVHTGEAEIRDGHYFGAALNRAARLRGLGDGSQTVVSAATVELVRDDVPAGHVLHDGGLRELRGFDRPEHVHFLLPGGVAPPAAPATVDGTPPDAVLPVAPTTFVGRDADRDALRSLLERHRLVTVVGPGGIGKTRVAVEVASTWATTTSTGGTRVVAVDLAAVARAEEVADAIAGALGADPDPDDAASTLATLAESLATTPTFLLLDNCEHVVDAVRGLAAAVLRRRGESMLLATSQAPLGVPGETVYPLAGLPVGADSDAVRLFVERARAQDATWTPDADELDIVTAICGRLDGVPLAIELAAAHCRMLTPAEIEERLAADPATVLTATVEPSVARHRSVAAAIDWSLALLDDRDRLLLGRLSVFERGFTGDAAEAVCAFGGLDADAVRRGLTTLVDRSLVAAGRRGSRSRYWLLETIRRHAADLVGRAPAWTEASPEAPAVTFAREGDVWAIRRPSGTVRVKDSTGMRHLARLLSRRDVEVHVLDLVAAERGHAAAARVAVDGGLEVIDDAARRAYEARVREVAADVEEARAANDLGRLERAEAELDALTEQLVAARGLGGRARRTGATAERARVAVTKAIRQAVARIAEHAPDVAAHLDRAVRTGAFCSYVPGAEPSVTVELSVEPSVEP